MPVAASVLSAGLFAAALILFLKGVPGRLRGEPDACAVSPFSAREYLHVLLISLGSLVLHLAVVSAVRLISGKSSTLAASFSMYSGLDSRHYLSIARSGYADASGQSLNLVFFPGYPLLTGILMLALPEMLSGYLAAWLPFIPACLVLYRLFRLDREPAAARRVLIWLCLFPGAVFWSYPMSESLFLAASAAAVYFGRTRRWLAAGVCGFAAAFTRSLGILLLLPLGIELLQQHLPLSREKRGRFFRDGACLLLIPLAFLVYLHINAVTDGDPLAFLTYQKSNWHQSAGWFFNTAGVQAEYALRTWTEEPVKFWGLWMPNLLTGFACLLLMVLRGRKLRLSEGAWFFVYFGVAYGTTWLLSGPRYMAVFWPMALLTEELPAPKWARAAALGAASLFYCVCFAMRWGVW